jgi:acetyl-CoA acetyltransferase
MRGLSLRAQSNAVIAGIGALPFGQYRDESTAAIANRAVSLALADARLERKAIDGLIVHIGSPRGLDVDEMAKLLALDIRFASETWSHGRFCGTIIQHAAMAIDHGLADYVVCVAAFRNSLFTRHGTTTFPGFAENFREGGGPHAETPHAGLVAPIGGAALSTQRYLSRYSIDREKLAAVPLAQRKAALLNPLAVMKQEMTEQDYRNSPYVAEPLRRLDCSVPVDVAVAVILTAKERAADLRAAPVAILSFQGIHVGPNEFVFGQPALGITQRDDSDYTPLGKNEPVFRSAGIAPSDIDTLQCYDGFSSQVLWTLERFGFAGPGESAAWIQGGRIGLGGELPTNTSGGHLSEGHSNGWGQTVEIIRQLRGEAGARQVKDCRLGLWATTFGDAVLYGRA